MLDARCPCGSDLPEAGCCAAILAGAPAPTALALMRSRYTAYVRGAVDHLIATHDPATRRGVDRAGLVAWTAATTWAGLTIVATVAGGVDDATGIVEFAAAGVHRGAPFTQRERSRFRRLDQRWVYVDGAVAAPERPGPNAPCPCGSGTKYKRCHGRG
ncbi:MAG: SEC-C domain-containing protein [Myxococcales bacterium]|nr:SEC-C domain-containing protein [Myxococcales bacterium]